jgi:hypothetical protein
MIVVVQHTQNATDILRAILVVPKASASIIRTNNLYNSEAHDKHIPCCETFLTAVSFVAT